MKNFNRFLEFLAMGIFLVFAVGGLAFLAFGKAKIAYGLRNFDFETQKIENQGEKIANETFSLELGRIRTRTKPAKNQESGAVVYIAVFMECFEGGAEFLEELNAKSQSIKSIFLTFFPRYTERELLLAGENSVKTQILNEINGILAMGSVKNLYFPEYQFFE